ncbi:dihydroorotase [bacterium]|nr:dihydroorotase [bacterium]
MTLLIKNGHLVDAAQKLDGAGYVFIKDGSIAASAPGTPPASLHPDDVIDARGMLVTPGFIDLHVHLREPGQESKETIESGCRAAVAGGFASIVCMPNTVPTIDHASIVKFVHLEAQRVGLANVFPAGTVSRDREGKELADIGELATAGVVALTDDGAPVMDAGLMLRALEYARMFGIAVMDHCEDPQLTNFGVMNEGFYSTKLGLRGIPSVCEDVMVARDILLAEYTGGRIHIQHISTAHAVRMVREAKQRGVHVTCEVTPHHFSLTDAALSDYDTNFKMRPPLRAEEDRAALLRGIADGTIDAIATDHAPHTDTDKNVEFDYAADGVIGLESALPVAYTKLVKEGALPLMRLVELLTCGPAAIIGKDKKGTLRPGADADVTIWNPNASYTIDAGAFRSKARNCPFHGWAVNGKVIRTIVAGETKYEAV